MRQPHVTRAVLSGSPCLFTFSPSASAAPKPPHQSKTCRPCRLARPDDERKAIHVPPGFEVSLSPPEPDIHKPLEPGFRRSRTYLGDEHRRISLPGPRAHPSAQCRRGSVRLSGRRTGENDRDVRRWLERPDRPVPLPSAGAAPGDNIPNIYLMRNMTAMAAPAREVFYGIYGNRDTHGMTNAFSWGFDGWIYACHGYQRLPCAGQGSSVDSHGVREHLPHEAGWVARRVFHPDRSTRSAWHSSVGQPVFGRLPQPAGVSVPAWGVIPASASPTTVSGLARR